MMFRRHQMVRPVLWCCSIAIVTAVACAPEQVHGSIDGPTATETFAGTARGSAVDGSGNLTFTTNTGLTCSGRFVYLTAESARGTFDCGNGQGGPFDLARSGERWVGTGIVGNRRVAIELGHL